MHFGRFRKCGVVALAALLAITVGGCGRPAPERLSAFREAPSNFAPSRNLLLLTTSGRLDVVDAATGRIVRTVRIRGASVQLEGPTVAPDGTVYATRSARLCRDDALVSISLATGAMRVVEPHAFGAVSPDGRYLAWVREIAPPARYGEPQFCATGRTTVRDLATGATSTWNIATIRSGDLADQLIDSIEWSTDSRRLVLASSGDVDIPSLTQILDIDAPQSAGNPTAVGGEIVESAPILLPDGDVMGVVDTCPDNASCPGQTPPLPRSTIDVIDPATGAVVSSFRSNPTDDSLAVDPSGRRIEVLLGGSTSVRLERLVHQRLQPTITVPIGDYGGFTWIPRPASS